jgi:hypothetical protein
MDAVSVLKGRGLKRQHNEMVSICFMSPFYNMYFVRKSQQQTENLIFVILVQDFVYGNIVKSQFFGPRHAVKNNSMPKIILQFYKLYLQYIELCCTLPHCMNKAQIIVFHM